MACGVTTTQIYQALRGAGYSTIQAIGIMANMYAESKLCVTSANPDPAPGDPGAWAYGLVSFNSHSYPQAANWIKGTPQQALDTQVAQIKQAASGQAVAGSTAQQVAGNFAAYFERCQTCSPGNTGANGNTVRQGYVATVTRMLGTGVNAAPTSPGSSSNSGPSSTPSSSSSSSPTSSSSSSGGGDTCAWTASLGFISGCIISKKSVRQVIGTGVVIMGGITTLAGLFLLMKAASGTAVGAAGKAGADALTGAVSIFMPEAGAAMTAAGRANKTAAKHSERAAGHREAAGEHRVRAAQQRGTASAARERGDTQGSRLLGAQATRSTRRAQASEQRARASESRARAARSRR